MVFASLAWKPFDDRFKSIVEKFEDDREYLLRRAQTASRTVALRERSESAISRSVIEGISHQLKRELQERQSEAHSEYRNLFISRPLAEYITPKGPLSEEL